MFGVFDVPSGREPTHSQWAGPSDTRRSPSSLLIFQAAPKPSPLPIQLGLVTRLKSCFHPSDPHGVNDPGLLIFATRLCRSFPCAFGGVHPDASIAGSDGDHLLPEDSWTTLKGLLEPGGESDGENRINMGRIAAELIIRAAHPRVETEIGSSAGSGRA